MAPDLNASKINSRIIFLLALHPAYMGKFDPGWGIDTMAQNSFSGMIS